MSKGGDGLLLGEDPGTDQVLMRRPGRGFERVRVITFKSYYLRVSTEVGVRAEGGRTQKPAQRGAERRDADRVSGYLSVGSVEARITLVNRFWPRRDRSFLLNQTHHSLDLSCVPSLHSVPRSADLARLENSVRFLRI